MTVNEIRDAREELESKILKLCEEFRIQTSFAVTGCEIRSEFRRAMQDKHSQHVTTGVSIDLESI